MINSKFDVEGVCYSPNDWDKSTHPEDYYKSYFFVVGLKIQNHVVKVRNPVEWCECGYHTKDNMPCDL